MVPKPAISWFGLGANEGMGIASPMNGM